MKNLLSHLEATMLLLLVTFVSNVEAETTTFSYTLFQGQGTATTGSTITAAQNGITISGTKGYGSQAATSTYTRIYVGNVLTITPSSGITISNVKITTTDKAYSGGAWTASTGTVTRSTNITTWEGNTTTAFTLSNSTILYLVSIEVTYSKANQNENPYTVTFNAGTNGTCNTGSLKEASANTGVVLPVCTAKEGYKFLGWSEYDNNTTPDAGMTDATYYPSSNCTLYAVYKSTLEITSTYTITWNVDGVETYEEVAENNDVTFSNPTAVPTGYTFVGWTTTSIDGSTNSAQTCITSATATSDITYYALLKYTTSATESWTKITNTADVVDGTYAIISYDEKYYLPNVDSNSYPTASSVTKSNNVIDIKDDMKWNLTISSGYIKLESFTNPGHYFCNTSSTPQVKSVTTKSGVTSWSVVLNETYGVILYITINNANKYLSIYDVNKDWRTYALTNIQNPANLYKLTEGMAHYCTSTHETITTNVNGVTSYVTKSPLDFDDKEGLTAYLATGLTATTVTLAKATKVPAGTALVVNGTASTEYSLPIAADAPTTVTNIFKASDGTYTVEANDYIYALATDGKFKKVASGVTIPAGKAYLKSDTPLSAKTLTLNYESADIDAISSVKAENTATIPVKKYIKNGHIIIVKGNTQYNAVGSQTK